MMNTSMACCDNESVSRKSTQTSLQTLPSNDGRGCSETVGHVCVNACVCVCVCVCIESIDVLMTIDGDPHRHITSWVCRLMSCL
mmetsp:Transcript_36621/g.72013  ORF Transcript_36621/g.72013 Transcript_36621/m.72013 type:complete len:84 (+) Transcript_36621:139-390(+)